MALEILRFLAIAARAVTFSIEGGAPEIPRLPPAVVSINQQIHFDDDAISRAADEVSLTLKQGSFITRHVAGDERPQSVTLESRASLERRLESRGAEGKLESMTFLEMAAPIVQMSAGGTGGDDQHGALENWWEREKRQYAESDEYVYVERREKKQEAVQYAHAECPALDYRSGQFSAEDAAEFAEEVHEFPGGVTATGRELLALLLTPEALRTDLEPDFSRLDPEAVGVGEAVLRERLKAKDLAVHRFHDLMSRAFNRGLIYRIHVRETGKTYYGVPRRARDALGLSVATTIHEPVHAAETGSAEKKAFASALAALAKDAEALPPRDELFEFAAQAVQAAVERKLAAKEDFSEAFWRRSDAIGFDAPPLQDGLITLLESSHGTAWFGPAKELCLAAAKAGLIEPRLLEDILRDLR